MMMRSQWRRFTYIFTRLRRLPLGGLLVAAPTQLGAHLQAGAPPGHEKADLLHQTGARCHESLTGRICQVTSEEGQLRHVRVWDDERLVVEMSGHVVLNADMQVAETLGVEVSEEQLKAFGTFSTRWALTSCAVHFVFLCARWAISIRMEASAESGQTPWWRTLIDLASGPVLGQWLIQDMFSVSMSGEPPKSGTYWTCVISLALAVALKLISASLIVSISEFFLPYIGVFGVFIAQPLIMYRITRQKYPTRRFWPSLQWSMQLFVATMGCAVVFASIGFGYALLYSMGRRTLASFFLPSATALAETGMAAFIRHSYKRTVASSDRSVVGDQLYIPVARVQPKPQHTVG
ncbi:unnamed protein product [Effrenium voratum]|nr:unnamed protein product [Effrenium voratum]